MEFINLRLLVSDFAAAISFWRDLVKLEMKYHYEEARYAYFETGASGVELLGRDDFASAIGETTTTPSPAGHQAVLVFRVDDVDAMYADLIARGATAVSAPQDRAMWGVRAGHIHAHDGYILEIYTPLTQASNPTA
jgi:lactoylglutathione lyase